MKWIFNTCIGPPSYKRFILDLALIRQTVSEEKRFKYYEKKIIKLKTFKGSEHIIEKKVGQTAVSATQASSVTLYTCILPHPGVGADEPLGSNCLQTH